MMNMNPYKQGGAAPQYYYYPMPQQTSGAPAAGMPPGMPTGMPTATAGASSGPIPVSPAASGATPSMLPVEESFIENILRLNLGKMVTLYMTYENNSEWNAKIFRGVLEAAGRDHIIISDPKTGMRYLLLMVNLDYATFDEPLQYSYPYR